MDYGGLRLRYLRRLEEGGRGFDLWGKGGRAIRAAGRGVLDLVMGIKSQLFNCEDFIWFIIRLPKSALFFIYRRQRIQLYIRSSVYLQQEHKATTPPQTPNPIHYTKTNPPNLASRGE